MVVVGFLCPSHFIQSSMSLVRSYISVANVARSRWDATCPMPARCPSLEMVRRPSSASIETRGALGSSRVSDAAHSRPHRCSDAGSVRMWPPLPATTSSELPYRRSLLVTEHASKIRNPIPPHSDTIKDSCVSAHESRIFLTSFIPPGRGLARISAGGGSWKPAGHSGHPANRAY